MTVQELYNWCKAYKHKSAQAYLCKDRDRVDEDGCLCDLYELNDIETQTAIIDEGVEFVDVQEVILTFNEERAGLNIEL